MRRPVVFFACLIVVGSNLSAQAGQSRVGFTAAVNRSHVDGSGAAISNRSGRAFGVYTTTPIAGAWSLQSGAVWAEKGWERDEPGTRDLASVKLAYVEVPVLLRYDIDLPFRAPHQGTPRARAGAVLFAGPGFALRTGCTISTTDASSGVTAEASCSEIDDLTNGAFAFQSFDVGAIAGGGIRFAAGRANVLATAQYELGLRNIQKNIDSKNRSATIAVGIEVPFGK